MTEDAATRRDLDRHEREIEKLWEQKASKSELAENRDEMRGLRQAVIAAAITVAVTALGSAAWVIAHAGPHS